MPHLARMLQHVARSLAVTYCVLYCVCGRRHSRKLWEQRTVASAKDCLLALGFLDLLAPEPRDGFPYIVSYLALSPLPLTHTYHPVTPPGDFSASLCSEP